MKFSSLLSQYTLLSLLPSTLAYPGMGEQLSQLQKSPNKKRNSGELLGDLKTLSSSQLTTIGSDIKAILQGSKSAESSTIDQSIPAGNVGTAACKADLCCVWKWIAYEMTAKFNGTSGRCTKFARAAVRLGFHDAGVWSTSSSYGGADGSILLTDEINRAENAGLELIAEQTKAWYNKYKAYGVTMADLIQFGANVATVVCPLGPRLRTFVGRKDNARAGPTGLLPAETDSADKLISLFKAKTIDAHDLVALVGAHTTSQQHKVDTSRDGDPQDSTPGLWDVAFYGETLSSSTPVRVLKFRSDVALSKHSEAKSEWQAFVSGQGHWNSVSDPSPFDYAKAYTRLSLLGVNNINDLKECTKVLPPERKSFVSQDQVILNRWLNGEFDQLNDMVDNAVMLTGVTTGGKKN
ncbi:class II peroxidase [Sporormia fimetaria CBS 119925]|uniref:Peroxidase n=1 Tax=Sporormia fimetaria CBS 119925 TaxID=1340428 RepID=A0A6A6VG22_9PLEO|nr:class II peroxidase [Sporormia fimetaria CBS 119925]